MLAEDYLSAADPKDKEVREIQVKSYKKSGAGRKKLHQALTALVKLHPETKAWWLDLARLDVTARDTSSAIRHGLIWVEQHPKSAEGFSFLEPLLARRASETANYEKVLEKLIALEPGRANSRRLSLGMLRYKQGNYQSAEKLLSQSVKVYPNKAKLWYYLGQMYSRPEFKGTGKQQFRKAYQLSPENIEYILAYSATIKTDNEIKKNLPLFKRLVKRSPTVMDRIKLAKAYHLNREYASAAREWEAILKIDSSLVYAQPLALQSFLKAGKSQRVLAVYEMRLESDPGNLKLLDTLCGIYKKTKNKQKYFKAVERVVNINMDYKNYQLDYAKGLVVRKDTNKALAHYTAWLDRHPRNSQELESMFAMAKAARDTSAMMNGAGKLAKLKASPKKYQYLLAELEFKANLEVKPLERLVKSDPKYKKGRALLVEYYYGHNKISKLIPYARYLETESRRKGKLLAPLAEVQAQTKKYSKANTTFFKALKLRKKDRKFYDRVLKFSTAHKSPHLHDVLSIGYKSFPDDLEIKLKYAKSLGTSPRALGVYKELLNKESGHLKGLQEGSRLALTLKKPKLAVEWLEKWGKERPGNPEPWRKLSEIHKAGKDSGRMADALVKLAAAVPRDHKLAYRIGLLFKAMGKTKYAIKYFERAVILVPANPKYKRQWGLALVTAGKLEKAKQPLYKIYSDKKYDEELIYAMYLVYQDEKNTKTCRKLLRRLVKRKPEVKAYAYPLAELEAQLNNPKGAIKVLAHPRLKSSLNKEMAGLLLRQYVTARQVGSSAAYGKEVARKYPKQIPPELGVFLYKNKRTYDARKMLDAAIKHNPSDEAYYCRARLAFKDRVWKTAIKYFRKARSFNKESYNYLGKAYESSRDYERAIDAYEDYYKETKKKQLLIKLYELYKREKDKGGICDVLERLAEAYPKSFSYQRALAEAYLDNKQRRKAEKQFAVVLKRSPKHAKANLYVGLAEARSKKCKTAIKRLRIGTANFPRNQEAWERLGDCYTIQKKATSASRAYARAEALKKRKKKK